MKKTFSDARLLLRLVLSDRPARIMALMLGIGVIVLITVYGLSVANSGSPFAAFLVFEIGLSQDRSMGEIVGYGMAFLAATLFFVAFLEIGAPVLLFAASLMGFAWFDDSAGYHERVGEKLASLLDLPTFAGLRPQDTGELLAWLVPGALLGLLLVLCILRRSPGDLGILALVMGGFGLLVLFGVVADMIHVAAPTEFGGAIGLIEDGGEMLVISMLAALAIGLSRNGRAYCEAAALSGREA